MLQSIIEKSEIKRDILVKEIKAIHEKYKTSEYAFLIEEIPSLQKKHPNSNLTKIYDDAIHKYRKTRKEHLKLYPSVYETLTTLKEKGVLIIGYTESMEFYTNFRIRTLGLDGILDYIYSPADHEIPKHVNIEKERKHPNEHYELQLTKQKYTPKGKLKPNKNILLKIISEVKAKPNNCLYIGDSLMKDIFMAQSAKVTDLYAQYGVANKRIEYELLKEVTHWTKKDVEKEKKISKKHVNPSFTAINSFSEILALFNFIPHNPSTLKNRDYIIDIWKETIRVQKHFNELELKIRNFAITILGAFLGTIGFSIKENIFIEIHKINFHLSVFLLVGALITWLSFYMMDRLWYHRLLYGAVKHAMSIEDKYKIDYPELSLTHTVGEESPFKFCKWEIHSTRKMDLFYGLITVIIISLIILFSLFLNDKKLNEINNSKVNIQKVIKNK